MKKYFRFVFGLRKYLRDRTSPERALQEAMQALRDRVAHREDNFLSLLERGVFGFSKSPYLPLLQQKKMTVCRSC